MARSRKSQQSMTAINAAGVTPAGQARGAPPQVDYSANHNLQAQLPPAHTNISSQPQVVQAAYLHDPQDYDEYSSAAALQQTVPQPAVPQQTIPQQSFHQSPHPHAHPESAMSQSTHHASPLQPGQAPPGQSSQQYPPQQQWDDQAQSPQQYARGYAQAVAAQQGYRPAQSQVSQAQVSQAQVSQAQMNPAQITQAQMTQAQASQIQARQLSASQHQAGQAQARQLQPPQIQGNLATSQSSAIQRSRQPLDSTQAPLATHHSAPQHQRSFGPTHPSQYLQPPPAQSPAQVPAQQGYGRDRQPYGHHQPQGQRQIVAGGTAGWTGDQSNALRRQRLASQGSAINRRSRYALDEDFVPGFGSPTPVVPGSFAWPVINWHNLPLGNMRFWTALGGIVFAAIMLNVLGTSPVISSIVKTRNRQCQEVVQKNSVLSRQQLTQLLAVPERSPQANIHDIIREPYCLLPSLNIRAGVNAVREAYPLEFDPDTWIVVLYEGDEYAGYRFNAR